MMLSTIMLAAAAAAAAPQSADLIEIDRLLTDVYAVISGPSGQKRDFAKMRSMFAPGATLRYITPKGLGGGTLDDYIAKSGPLLEKDGFNERELGRRVEQWGDLAHAWSSYDGRTATGSFQTRGINSFQLVKVDGRWKVASILWAQETPANPIPADMDKESAK